jgi:hypothetical protein
VGNPQRQKYSPNRLTPIQIIHNTRLINTDGHYTRLPVWLSWVRPIKAPYAFKGTHLHEQIVVSAFFSFPDAPDPRATIVA